MNEKISTFLIIRWFKGRWCDDGWLFPCFTAVMLDHTLDFCYWKYDFRFIRFIFALFFFSLVYEYKNDETLTMVATMLHQRMSGINGINKMMDLCVSMWVGYWMMKDLTLKWWTVGGSVAQVICIENRGCYWQNEKNEITRSTTPFLSNSKWRIWSHNLSETASGLNCDSLNRLLVFVTQTIF